MTNPITSFGSAQVTIHSSPEAAGASAAAKAAELIGAAILKRGTARVVAATGNSQLDLIDALTARKDISWDRVEVFHMDEYVGISSEHPASFRRWLKERVASECRPARVHYVAGDALNPEEEAARYAHLLNAAPIDLAFVGFGENGHIAFNDPPVADFADPATVKVVTLDLSCRQQQVGEGHFQHIAAVPERAITITCPGLFRAAAWICCVPERRKATAVQRALEGPISTDCPASIVRTHPAPFVFLDTASASQLQRTNSYLGAQQPVPS